MTDYSREQKVVVATSIFKMKVQYTMEKTVENHLQDTYEAKIIFEEDAHE